MHSILYRLLISSSEGVTLRQDRFQQFLIRNDFASSVGWGGR